MDILIGIIGIVIGILIAIIPFFWHKYFLRPELTIEFIRDGGMSNNRGFSAQNSLIDGTILASNNPIIIFELTWNFKIRITNNSEMVAYYPELEFKPSGPKLILLDKLNKFHPIMPAETVQVRTIYKKVEEKTGQERTDIGRHLPTEFQDFEILLKYQNSKKIKAYTLYKHNGSGNKNLFIKKLPREYVSN